MAQTVTIVLRVACGLLLATVPCSASAQVGRIFVSAEVYAGVSRIVYVGKIVELQRVDYEKPLTPIQEIGKPHRLVFEVGETIRGDEVRRLDLVLSLQSTHDLEYMRDHSVQIMLVGGPTRLDRFPIKAVGIEERGKRADDEWYQFRVLDPIELPESGAERAIASHINTCCDSGRMFTGKWEVIVGSKEILKRVRDFAKRHPETLSGITLQVPNEFGALCGDPNAFCAITLPVCPETKANLIALKADPGLILRRIESRDESYNRSLLTAEADKALAQFAVDDGK
jgi:hypothetical protein